MAVLSSNDRALVVAELMRVPDCPGTVTKADLRAAIDAADSWVDSNSAAFNLALPLIARNTMTARQKAAVLMFVVQRRFGVS